LVDSFLRLFISDIIALRLPVILFLCALCGAGATVYADDNKCANSNQAAQRYHHFVAYRQAINKARAPADLAKYFTPAFNAYFQQQLAQASNDKEKNRALLQYWDNLNSAADVISVYRYNWSCRHNRNLLVVLGSLKSDLPDIGGTIAVWRIRVEYKQSGDNWLIDNIEFNKSNKTPKHLRLLNNFTVIP